MPRISVCCSVLNQSQLLMEMINSVRQQTYTDWELLIVDDGSTENIKEVVTAFNDERVKLIKRFDKNKGIPHGINYAMRHATGEFINPLAADELLTPQKFETQIAYMDEHPKVDAIWGLPQNGQIEERPTWEQFGLQAHNRSREHWLRTLLNLENVPIGGASMLARRAVFEELGYFDPQLEMFSDHEWFVRFFEAGKQGRVLPYRWALSRETEESVSKRTTMKKYTRELQYVRDRHRLEPPAVEPSVSVGIPVYNMAHWIGDTLKSLFEQTVPPNEIIIIDDCSTDNLAEVLSQYNDPRIKFFRFDENRGHMVAQNQMITMATGMFYVPLSADDTVDKTFIEKCLAQFKSYPWLEFVSTQTDFIDAAGVQIREDSQEKFHRDAMVIPKPVNQPRERWLQQLYYGNIYFGAGMYRRNALVEVGGWDKSHGVIADYEMYLRLLQRENISIVEEKLTHTRLHEKNHSNLETHAPSTDGKTLKQLYYEAKKPYYPPKMKVIIATPFYEMRGFAPYITSLAWTIKTLHMCGIEHEFWELSGDSYVDRARNTICTKFLEDPEATDLFFIDSDMQWNPEAFVHMLMQPEEVVGGSYPTKNLWNGWTSHPILKEEDGKLHPIGRALPDGSALLKAEAVASGFLRIKRSALEKFRDHYPDFRYKEPYADPSNKDRTYIEFFACGREGMTKYGEDMMFCKRLREMGMDMFIYPNVNIGHYGVKGWLGNYDKFLKGGGQVQDDSRQQVH